MLNFQQYYLQSLVSQVQYHLMMESLTMQKRIDNLKQKVHNFPFKCKLYVNMLLSQLPNCSEIQIPNDFKKAYSSLSQTFIKQNNEEKLFFIEEISDHLFRCLTNGNKETSSIPESIETSCEVKGSFVGFHVWQKKIFKYSHQYGRITLSTSKKGDTLLLKNYLVRRSASEKDSIVLQSISKAVPEKLSKITIKFGNSSIFSELYRTIRENTIQLSQQTLEEFLQEDLKQGNVKETGEGNSSGNKFTILTTKNVTQYFKKKESLYEKMKVNKKRCMLIYNMSKMKIFRSSENKKYYYLEKIIEKAENIENIKENTPILGSKSIPNKLVHQVLQSFTHNITANYYKFQVGPQEYEFLVITERINRDGYHETVMKTVTHFIRDVEIQYIVVNLKKITENSYSLEIGMHLKYSSKKKAGINQQVQSLMNAMAFNDPFVHKKPSRKTIAQSQNLSVFNPNVNNFEQAFKPELSIQEPIGNLPQQQNFTTSSGRKEESEPSEQQQEFYSIVSSEQNEDLQDLPQPQIKEKQTLTSYHHLEIQTDDYLKIKPFTKPLLKKTFTLQAKHFLDQDWGKSFKGGVVCINQEVIRQQNRILKLVITRIGVNVFKGNSVMNVSLPVQLFRDQSSLISIGRNITFAPLLIEPFVDCNPIQRMKNIVIFEISMASLALSTKKPFNPILGETYQGIIGGCPLFVQQISHHPPITSIYFVGRGYKIYGTMKIEAHLSVNSARGINNARLTIQLDNGNKIDFSLPVMLINGLLFGQRSIYFEETIHIVDYSNLIIAQITYDAYNAKKGFFNFKNFSPDYLCGEIYKVSQDFMNKFKNCCKKPFLKKGEGCLSVSKFHGEWNGKIFIDNNEVYDFGHQLPVKLENVNIPLPSDSTFRPDVIQLSKGLMDSSQDEKDRLQQLQRRDKKLRQKYQTRQGKK